LILASIFCRPVHVIVIQEGV